jgi:hypothetical protein
MRKNVSAGISLPHELMMKIDDDRGDVSRSKYILRIIQKNYGGDKIA